MAVRFRRLPGLFRHFTSVIGINNPVNYIPYKGQCKVIHMASPKGSLSLVVGLGNHSMPNTRHSVGMAVVNHLAEKLGAEWSFSKKYQGYLAMTQIPQQNIILLKPKLLMNVNGRSIVRVVSAYNIQPSHVILVHDELDKALGKFSIKYGGSAGGHKGVKSSINQLMSLEMVRLRVGIGRPVDRSQVSDYVLQDFSESEKPILTCVLEECSQTILNYLHPSDDTTHEDHSSSKRKRKHGKVS